LLPSLPTCFEPLSQSSNGDLGHSLSITTDFVSDCSLLQVLLTHSQISL
jgi:hypothetical protein